MNDAISLIISAVALIITSLHCACRWKRGGFEMDAELEPKAATDKTETDASDSEPKCEPEVHPPDAPVFGAPRGCSMCSCT